MTTTEQHIQNQLEADKTLSAIYNDLKGVIDGLSGKHITEVIDAINGRLNSLYSGLLQGYKKPLQVKEFTGTLYFAPLTDVERLTITKKQGVAIEAGKVCFVLPVNRKKLADMQPDWQNLITLILGKAVLKDLGVDGTIFIDMTLHNP